MMNKRFNDEKFEYQTDLLQSNRDVSWKVRIHNIHDRISLDCGRGLSLNENISFYFEMWP